MWFINTEYTSPSIKEQAKQIAMNILKSRFCSTVKHNNPSAGDSQGTSGRITLKNTDLHRF